MRISYRWLRDYVDLAVTAEQLARDLTLIGLEVSAVESWGEDRILELEVTTNRPDCLNIYGVAREAAARYGIAIKPLPIHVSEQGPPVSDKLRVELIDPQLCPRYAARVAQVKVGPSPSWLRDRLESVGVRPINNVVDLTNYVLVEMGHPTHAFDLERLAGARLIIRQARAGEGLRTLDGVERRLQEGMLVIADPDRPQALAGVMGGADSEVGGETTWLALESACFQPLQVRRTAKALGMHTEASHRFERGADPEAPLLALDRLATLLEQIEAGRVLPGVIDLYPKKPVPTFVMFRPGRVEEVFGASVAPERSRQILSRLGFELKQQRAREWKVGVPSFRVDVSREIDLVEEVARHQGYDATPPTLPAWSGPPWRRPGEKERERLIRQLLAGAGFFEMIGTGFVEVGVNERLGVPAAEVLPVLNPLSEKMGAMRASLLSSLVEAAGLNRSRRVRDIKLFEIGKIYLGGSHRGEQRRLALGALGARARPAWNAHSQPVEFFDMKGVLEAIFSALRLPPPEFTPRDFGFLAPGTSAAMVSERRQLGCLGRLSQDLEKQKDLGAPLWVAELDLEWALSAPAAPAQYRPLPRFPAISRDLSLLVERSVLAGRLASAILVFAPDLIREVSLTGSYAGPELPAEKVSLTFNLLFRSEERTLTGEEVNDLVERLVNQLRHSFGAELRG